jgi:hypothetical protein
VTAVKYLVTEVAVAVANEIGFHIDDAIGETVLDEEERSLGTTYADTTVRRLDGAMYRPAQFAIVLANGTRLRVTVEQEQP